MTSPHTDPPVLALRGASFAHRHGPRIFSDATLEIRRGDKVALLGANGSGKTTLLRMLVGLTVPDSGALALDETPVGRREKDRDRLRRAVQLVLQEPDDQVFAASVRADVGFGPVNLGLPEREVERRVDEALDAVGIADLADRAPHLLSFGQRKRAALAGVLAMRPRVLLLDEPTAGLDPAATVALLATLDDLAAGGVGIVMATHEVDTAWRWATDAALLRDGRIDRGPAHEVLCDSRAVSEARLEMPWGAVIKRTQNRTVLHAGEL